MERRDVLLLSALAVTLLTPGRAESCSQSMRFLLSLGKEDLTLRQIGHYGLLTWGTPGLQAKAAAAFRMVHFRPSGKVAIRFFEEDMRPWAGEGEDFLVETSHIFPDGKFKEGREKVVERAAQLCFIQHRRRMTDPVDPNLVPNDWSMNEYLIKRMREETEMKRAVIPRLRFVEVDVSS